MPLALNFASQRSEFRQRQSYAVLLFWLAPQALSMTPQPPRSCEARSLTALTVTDLRLCTLGCWFRRLTYNTKAPKGNVP